MTITHSRGVWLQYQRIGNMGLREILFQLISICRLHMKHMQVARWFWPFIQKHPKYESNHHLMKQAFGGLIDTLIPGIMMLHYERPGVI